MNKIFTNGQYRDVTKTKIFVNGQWRDAVAGKIYTNGQWRDLSFAASKLTVLSEPPTTVLTSNETARFFVEPVGSSGLSTLRWNWRTTNATATAWFERSDTTIPLKMRITKQSESGLTGYSYVSGFTLGQTFDLFTSKQFGVHSPGGLGYAQVIYKIEVIDGRDNSVVQTSYVDMEAESVY